MAARTPSQRDLYEAQATECLAVAATYRPELLALAEKLAGSPEAAHDLYTQTCLDCHDTIQHVGLDEEPVTDRHRYRWYLRTAMKNLHAKQRTAAGRLLVTPTPPELPERLQTSTDQRAHLAEQISAEARARFTPGDRTALRLHAEGYSYRAIAEMMGGGDSTWLGRRIQKMLTTLRSSFRETWANLSD